VEDPEIKYGLSVTGVIHPDKVMTNTGAKVGDKLILTKPLGTGIINTAVKGGMASKKLVAKSVECMASLNKTASELMQELGAHACTDITGFGFLGHACEMIEGTDVGMSIDAASVPFFPEVQELVETGLVPAGLYRNRDFRAHMVKADPKVPYWMMDILFDPQTSGGLLIAIAPAKAKTLLNRLHKAGVRDAENGVNEVWLDNLRHLYLLVQQLHDRGIEGVVIQDQRTEEDATFWRPVLVDGAEVELVRVEAATYVLAAPPMAGSA
jgi:selenide,water dikinase